MRRGDGYADLSYVYAAVEEMAPHLKGFTVIVTKSTVPVGTSREIERRLRALRPDADFAVCSNPEFLREGSAIQDFMHPDRVLVGVDDERARELMGRLYKPLALRNAPVMFVGRESAELAKYAANSFLALKISFINEVADLCEELGADVQEVASAIGKDRRIGDKFLHPGPRLWRLVLPQGRLRADPHRARGQVAGVDHRAGRARQPRAQDRHGEPHRGGCGGSVRGKTVAILGVTFKPNTDDMRDAPSLVIVPMLQERGASVRAYDPQGRKQGEPLLPGVAWCESALRAAEGADVLVVVTEWNEFRALDLAAAKAAMRGAALVDLRNVFPPERAEAAGFTYAGIGRGKAGPKHGCLLRRGRSRPAR